VGTSLQRFRLRCEQDLAILGSRGFQRPLGVLGGAGKRWGRLYRGSGFVASRILRSSALVDFSGLSGLVAPSVVCGCSCVQVLRVAARWPSPRPPRPCPLPGGSSRSSPHLQVILPLRVECHSLPRLASPPELSLGAGLVGPPLLGFVRFASLPTRVRASTPGSALPPCLRRVPAREPVLFRLRGFSPP